ncbi:acyltransferase domain-containing protein [Streptomyces malaysiensis]|uniref:acyltransferase domain-containing protein n=1 Tax=Streptomyces malaysiensis TaxID=92644 RepID=UPI00368E55AA
MSGRTPAALCARAARLADWVDGRPGSGLVDLGGSLLSSRTFFDHRVVSLGVDGLRVLVAGGVGGNVVAGRVTVVVGRMVFVFPGRGSQWVGMARELVGGSLVFAARMDECGQVLESFTDWRLVDVLGEVDVLGRAEVVQSVVWVVVVWFAAVWRSLGVVLDAVLGHSRGEVAAVVVAGALSLEEGACVVALCAGTLGVLAGCGGMTSLVLSARGVRALIGPGFSVVTVDGSSSVVVAGVPEVLAVLEVLAGERDVRARRLSGFCVPV